MTDLKTTEITMCVMATIPMQFQVEAIDSDGGIETANFWGPCAEQRARDYAQIFYPHLELEVMAA